MKEDLVLIQLQELSLSHVMSIEIIVHLIYDRQYLFCFKKRVRDHVSHSECYVFDCRFTDSTFHIYNLHFFDRKMILVHLQLVLHLKQSIIHILLLIFEQRRVR